VAWITQKFIMLPQTKMTNIISRETTLIADEWYKTRKVGLGVLFYFLPRRQEMCQNNLINAFSTLFSISGIKGLTEDEI